MHSRSANLLRIDNDIIVKDLEVVDELDTLNKYPLYILIISCALKFNAMTTFHSCLTFRKQFVGFRR